ncbi:diguanylate cyclase [Desulfovibrio sp. X2]|uniref:sensor domain-containing diguanylate cyclase n=1 Tax=Desulfovibrio sp. X2 TaxID=941449 RepID=UPI000358BA30|nr:diguanylate cyclase [Desulfovibrio sp. X2]EPR37683.1 diguanylate cyclase [Desulfovibrio sp. X2]
MTRRRKSSRPESTVLKRVAQIVVAPPEGPRLAAEYADLAEDYRALVERFYKTIAISDAYQAQAKEMAVELERMTVKLRRLREVALPVCVRCHKVHAGDEYWQRLETFFIQNLDVLFSQGLCPDCLTATRDRLGADACAQAVIPSRPRRKAAPDLAEDKVTRELRELAQRAEREESPLAADIAKAAKSCNKLARRFAKTITISDSFQSQLQELNTRLELMARTDLLTGLSNRWEMASRLEAERSRAERHGCPTAVIVGDLDHFKTVNDTFGHLAGDKVLKAVAETLRKSLRREDHCGRWGGEEFLILLPETTLAQASQVAEKLREVVRSLRVEFEGRAITVTMSFGVGEFTPGMGLDDGLKMVDDALYAAKAGGRNQVVITQDRPPEG